jgi:hypothetical protein
MDICFKKSESRDQIDEIPCNLLLIREFWWRDRFAADCFLRQPVLLSLEKFPDHPLGGIV